MVIVLFSLLVSCNDSDTLNTESNASTGAKPTAIVIHGGAGNLVKLSLTPSEEVEFKSTISNALLAGNEILINGGNAVDAVEAAIKLLEDSPLFNAGKGAVFTHEGRNELDAAIMDGKDLSCGAVTGLRHIQNPISLAKLVMQQSEFVFLSGDGAEEFAVKHGFQLVDTSYFFTQHRWEQLQKNLKENEKNASTGDQKAALDEPGINDDFKFGTVGCVALDSHGNLAAGTSTGGTSNKQFGRIGDSPVIGAGTYANNKNCAVSCTGRGEDFIRNVVAYDIAALMSYSDLSLDSAVSRVIHDKLKPSGGRGGCIAIDGNANISMHFTTSGMYRGYIDKEGNSNVMIYRTAGDTIGVR